MNKTNTTPITTNNRNETILRIIEAIGTTAGDLNLPEGWIEHRYQDVFGDDFHPALREDDVIEAHAEDAIDDIEFVEDIPMLIADFFGELSLGYGPNQDEIDEAAGFVH